MGWSGWLVRKGRSSVLSLRQYTASLTLEVKGHCLSFTPLVLVADVVNIQYSSTKRAELRPGPRLC